MLKRLPNNFGSISKLSGNRTRPYMARLPNRKVLGYKETYQEAYLLLCEYHKNPYDIDLKHATFKQVWELFWELKSDNYSVKSQKNFKSLYDNFISKLDNKEYASFKTIHFLKFLDSLDCTTDRKKRIVTLLKHLDDIAFQLDITDKKYAYEIDIKVNSTPKEKVPFTESEIETLWENTDKEFVDCILMLIYTGFRINEFLAIDRSTIDLEEWTITGGIKTAAGKNRVVPIHPRIRPLVVKALETHNGRLTLYTSANGFREKFHKVLKELGLKDHVPHECRHTLRSRLDSAGARSTTIDKILGHKSGKTGEDVYTHKSVEELHQTMALIN